MLLALQKRCAHSSFRDIFLLGVQAKLRQVRRLFDTIQRQNAAITGRPGGQGHDGCWSANLRRAVVTMIKSLEVMMQSLYDRGVPHEVVMALRSKAMMTLCVESFFPLMRSSSNSGGNMPYASDCAMHREKVIAEQVKSTQQGGVLGFNYYTGPSRHYLPSGSASVPLVHVRLKKDSKGPSSMMNKEERREKLAVLRECARQFRKSRTGRVTDKGKHTSGTAPTAQRAAFSSKATESSGDLGASSRRGPAGLLSEDSRIIIPANSVVIVKVLHAGLFCPFQLVLLQQNLVESWVRKKQPKRKRGQQSRATDSQPKHHWVTNNPTPLVRDFHQNDDNGNLFEVGQTRRLSCAAFYGTVDSYFNTKTSSTNELTQFEVTEEQYEAASERVCSNIAAATADSEDDDSDGWCSDDSDDLGAAGKRESTVRVVTRRSMRPSAGRFNVWEMEGHRARS